MKKLFVLWCFCLACFAFSKTAQYFSEGEGVFIPSSPQRDGDSKLGYTYLITGDYLKSGIPYNYFRLVYGRNNSNYLKRDSLNAGISYEYTAVKAPNGEIVVAPNCLQCHAQVFDNKLVIGLGNTTIDFTGGEKMNPQNAAMAENFLQKADPKKYDAAEPFLKVVKAISSQLHTKVRGVNAADRLAGLLAAHRDPQTFRWNENPAMNIPDEVIPSDVPAWWLLKKKHGMFYNGFGRGDFSKFLMASNLLTVNDTSESREVDSHFNNVLAYLISIQPPKYPGPINKPLAKEGGVLFIKNCSKCHGNGDEYPNLLIPEPVIKTDSFLYKSNYQNPQFVEWFNNSWFAQGEHAAKLVPFNGYIAPPLDGVWITAPYFHNGSVPTLEALLNSKLRPKYWSRDFDNPEYDYEKIGWKYAVHDKPGGTTIYNTDLPGYGNYGHYYGDNLTDKERKAVIEYLKTL
jgi:processive rubber oxygenase RoxA-like protein